jgi:NADH-quinone oxidoreductase subunit J
MLIAFYLAGTIAVAATAIAITQRHAVHALIYLILSLLAIAVDFYLLGAPFLAALELIIYAGAIMVLFLFVVMMLNIGERATEVEVSWLTTKVWIAPALLAAVLLGELTYVVRGTNGLAAAGRAISAKEIGVSLFGAYAIGVELSSLLLTAGLVGAYHLGRRIVRKEEKISDTGTYATRPDASDDTVRAGADRATHAA